MPSTAQAFVALTKDLPRLLIHTIQSVGRASIGLMEGVQSRYHLQRMFFPRPSFSPFFCETVDIPPASFLGEINDTVYMPFYARKN